jgi:hypothetical protein
MNKPISQSEKRQKLFALLQDSEHSPNHLTIPVPQPQPPRPSAQTIRAQRQAEEVQNMLRKFVNPNADRWSLL